MKKILKLGTIITLTSLPWLSLVACSSSFNSEVEFLLNSLVDGPAKEMYSNTIVAEQKAREYSNSIKSGDENIASNIVNASIFTNYPLGQQIGQELVMQIQPLLAKQDGTTIILTVRIEYSFNDSNSVKHYSQDKKLVVQFYVPQEVESLLNSLVDGPAKKTYTNTTDAEQKAQEYSNSIKSGDENIASNIVNASIFTNYPLGQQIGQELVMQIQPLLAKQDGTTIILTVRIEYSFNDSKSVKHYSQDKKLVVQFYVPS